MLHSTQTHRPQHHHSGNLHRQKKLVLTKKQPRNSKQLDPARLIGLRATSRLRTTNQMPTLNLFHPLRFWSDEAPLFPEQDASDARHDAQNSLSARYAFALGEDLAEARQHPPEEAEHDDLRRGYVEGLKRPAKHANVYRRKVLQVRRNALRRSIPVSERFDTDYLQRISVTVCPVAGVELTQGTQTEADWSIDRLDNNLGYVPGNICILSARANFLKSSDDLTDVSLDVKKLLETDGMRGLAAATEKGLAGIEALRLAALMAGPTGSANGVIHSFPPVAMAPDVIGTIEAGIAGIHVGCARTRVEGRAYRRRVAMFKGIGTSTWRMSNRLVELIRAKLSANVHPCDMWFEEELVERLCDLNQALRESPPVLPDALEAEGVRQVFGGMAAFSQFTRSGK